MAKVTIAKDSFYQEIRKHFPKLKTLSQKQVDSMNAIINEFEKECNDIRWLAYMLATTYHETAGTMLPIEEYGRGKNRLYGLKRKYNGSSYSTPDKLFYGRGYVQLTWYENYDKFGKLLKIDLLNYPEKALEIDTASKILIEGMTKGLFTGVGLPKYFNSTMEDPDNARRIINGKDRYQLITEYYYDFKKCIKVVGFTK